MYKQQNMLFQILPPFLITMQTYLQNCLEAPTTEKYLITKEPNCKFLNPLFVKKSYGYLLLLFYYGKMLSGYSERVREM